MLQSRDRNPYASSPLVPLHALPSPHHPLSISLDVIVPLQQLSRQGLQHVVSPFRITKTLTAARPASIDQSISSSVVSADPALSVLCRARTARPSARLRCCLSFSFPLYNDRQHNGNASLCQCKCALVKKYEAICQCLFPLDVVVFKRQRDVLINFRIKRLQL